MEWRNTVLVGDVREQLAKLPDESVHCVVTSPPYWGLRDYGTEGQIGLEDTPEEYVSNLVDIFRSVRRVLRKDGTVWLNLGDCYTGGRSGPEGDKVGLEGTRRNQTESRRARESFRRDRVDAGDRHHKVVPALKPKDLVGIPWRVAFALQADGWWLRSDIIWSKPNPMPESVTDRPTKSHEYVFLLTKSDRYFYDASTIKVPASPNTHARISQKTLASQHGGPKQLDYQERSGRKRRDKSPAEMVKALAAKAPGVGPKAQPMGLGVKYNESFSAAVAGPVLSRNARTVWEIPTQPYAEAHFATYPEALVKPCIMAGCPEGGVVLDPFMGSGTTGLVAYNAGRDFVGIELNPTYAAMAIDRIKPERGRLL